MSHDEQQEFLDKVKALAGEHSVAFVFLAEVDCDEHVEGAGETSMVCVWDGGLTLCTGLLHRGLREMEKVSPVMED